MHVMGFLLLVVVLLVKGLHQVRALGCALVVNGVVTIPASVTSIATNAFRHCIALISASFAAGSQLTSIGSYAFYNTRMTSITIPASVTSIGIYAFHSCTALTSVSFAAGSQLTSIGTSAFWSSGLTSITLPASVWVVPVLISAMAPPA
jgi:hypothetical protein